MTTLKDYILHQLREIKREMLAAIEGLAEDDLAWLAAEDQGPIAWIVQHCCANVDFFIHKGITGQFCLEHEPRFLLWPLPPRRPDDAYPPRSELAERWSRLLDAGAAALESAGPERLQEPSATSRPTAEERAELRTVSPELTMADRCPCPGSQRELAHRSARDRIIEKARGGRGHDAISAIPHRYSPAC